MNFIADLHIHSRFSMATSKALTVPHLAEWAMRKGIQVLASGDFTHPKWRSELGEQLVLDEKSGFYRYRGELSANPTGAATPLFCLETEISSIYKKGGKTRKIHNLVYAPDLETAEKISRRLALVGNLNSDGRPILGLDSHDLLEMVLECSPRAVLVPAHIWTPWFSLFGSRSGFDCIEDCYGDLTSHIFALETGLSSDPPMNRCISALDKYALISNSDAHSGANLGREANIFAGAPTYDGMFAALRASAQRGDQSGLPCRFLGTCEFYPEEGKYHLDGHRACNIVLSPEESRKLGNICPVCGKPLTIGVLHRVMELADRKTPARPVREPEARMLVPLPEVIGQILNARPSTRKVQERYKEIISQLGAELHILCEMPEKEIRACWEPLGEAISRLRSGQVNLDPGYDGQYGVIGIFSAEEKREMAQGKIKPLPGLPQPGNDIAPQEERHFELQPRHAATAQAEFSPAQKRAIKAGPNPVFVIAGPGAGKTRTLVGRLQYLAESASPERLLAVTFTRKAAAEMRERVASAFSAGRPLPQCDTLHGLAWNMIRASSDKPLGLMNECEARELFRTANNNLSKKECGALWERLSLARETLSELDTNLARALENYNRHKKLAACVDYTDILAMLASKKTCGQWDHVLVDEMQDLTPLQLAVVASLLPKDGKGFFGIGDPDQAIYGFRGACADILARLGILWPEMETMRLEESYRSSQKILDLASCVLGPDAKCRKLRATKTISPAMRIFAAADEKAEARWIARNIAALLGPTAHSLLDGSSSRESLAPADVAILVRLKSQAATIAPFLEHAGIPVSIPSGEEYWQDERCAAFIAAARQEMPSEAPQIFLRSLALRNPEDATLSHLDSNPNFTLLCGDWEKCGSWPNFFENLAWLREAELITSKAGYVRLLTIHAAKGLEFHSVFIPGLENGLLPLDRRLLYGQEEDCNEAEEKRLLYVALTRASHGIYGSYCGKRRLYGRTFTLAPSPFLPALSKYCVRSHMRRQTRQVTEKLPLLPE